MSTDSKSHITFITSQATPPSMSTNAEIFAGPNKDLNLENILQVAKTNRNVDIVKKFNAGRIKELIHISTVGARISRSLDFIAERDSRNRQGLKEEFEADRARNGVAGRNQHTMKGKKRPVAEIEGDEEVGVPKNDASQRPQARKETPPKAKRVRKNHRGGDGVATPSTVAVKQSPRRKKVAAPKCETGEMHDSDAIEDDTTSSAKARDGTRAKKASPQMASGHREKGCDSVAESIPSSSPLLKNSKCKGVDDRPATSAAGEKRERDREDEDGTSGSQQGGRPQTAAKTSGSVSASSSLSSQSFDPAEGRFNSSCHGKGKGTAGDGSPSSTSSSNLSERSLTPSATPEQQDSDDERTEVGSPTPSQKKRKLQRDLDDMEANVLLSDHKPIQDDAIMTLASRHTVAEILRSANRGAGKLEYHTGDGTTRIHEAVERFARRKETTMSEQYRELDRKREANGIERGGRGR